MRACIYFKCVFCFLGKVTGTVPVLELLSSEEFYSEVNGLVKEQNFI